jgi:hypothetical protein
VILQVSRLWRTPARGIWYDRSRLPGDLITSVSGQTMSVEIGDGVKVGDGVSAVTLAPITKVSLRSAENREAGLLHASVQAQLPQHWASPTSLRLMEPVCGILVPLA